MNTIEKLLLSNLHDCDVYVDSSTIGFYSEEKHQYYIITKHTENICFLDIVSGSYDLIKTFEIPIVYLNDFLIQTTNHSTDTPHLLLTNNSAYPTSQMQYDNIVLFLADFFDNPQVVNTTSNEYGKKPTLKKI